MQLSLGNNLPILIGRRRRRPLDTDGSRRTAGADQTRGSHPTTAGRNQLRGRAQLDATAESHVAEPAGHIHIFLFGPLQKRVLQQIRILGPSFEVLLQAQFDKIPEVRTEVLILGQAGRTGLQDFGKHFEVCFTVAVGKHCRG